MASTYELIASQTLGSDTASVTFSSIPATYDDLLLVCSVRTARSALTDALAVEFNSSTTSYSWRRLEGNGSTAASDSGTGSSVVAVNGNTSTASTFATVEIYIPNYAGSTNKSYSVTGAQETNATGAEINVRAALWSNTAAITSIKCASGNAANLKSNSSFYLFGIKHS